MIDLYTWGTPNGIKVSIALEEMGLEYKTHSINIMKDEQFAPEFLKISPNNKIPAIVDHETGQSVFETGAILLYLAEKTGKFMPSGTAKWDVMQWLMWQMGGFGPMLGQAHHFVHFNPDVSEYAQNRYRNEAKRLYGVLDKQLAGKDFVIGGEMTIADFAIFPWTAKWDWKGVEITDYPEVTRWYKALAERPAFQKGYNVPEGDPEPRIIPLP